MNEIKRLQELAGINEIKVNKPISKREVFDYFLNNNKLILMSNFLDEDLETVINDNGFDSLEEYGGEYGIDPNMIKLFYGTGLNNEIGYVTMGESEDAQKLEDLSNYKNIFAQGDGDTYVFIFGHNL